MSNLLLTLDQAKDQLEIASSDTTQDTRVGEFNQAVADHIEWYCDRKFSAQDYTQLFTGDQSAALLLWQFPINTVASVNVDRRRDFLSGTLLASMDFAIHREIVLLRKQNGMWPKWPGGIQVAYNAGFSTIPSDLQNAARHLLSMLWDMRGNRAAGVLSRGKLGESTAFKLDLPPPVIAILDQHKRENYLARRLKEL